MRRGLILIDPPYDRPDDFARLAEGITAAHRKWPSGIYMVRYQVPALARILRWRSATDSVILIHGGSFAKTASEYQ